MEIVESNKVLDIQQNFNPHTAPKDLDIPFIYEGSNNDRHNLTSCESNIASSSNIRKTMQSDSKISENLTITPIRTIFYSKSEKEILTCLLEHYRELNLFGIQFTGLCIHKLYRITLVACNTFIPEPIYKLCLMTLVLLIVAIVNSVVKPYNDHKANYASSFCFWTLRFTVKDLNFWSSLLGNITSQKNIN